MPNIPHNDFTIRRATSDDTESILSLIHALAEYENLSHAVIATREDLEKFGFTEHAVFQSFIAETPAAAIGFALYFYTFSTFAGRPTLYGKPSILSVHRRPQKVYLVFQRGTIHLSSPKSAKRAGRKAFPGPQNV